MPTVIDLTTLGADAGFIIQGDAVYDLAGRSVSSAGDVDGDGFDDLIIGAPLGDDGGTYAGEAYVIFGKSTGFGTDVAGRRVIDLTALAAADGFIIQGDAATDRAGASVSSAGDVNGDGFDDLIVGAYLGDDGGTNAGEAYVIFGKSTGFGTDVAGRRVVDLTSLAAADGFIIPGDAVNDRAGDSVSSAGDVNGDGFEDIIVSVRLGDDGGYNAGEAYVIFGKSTGFGNPVVSPEGHPRQVIDLTSLAAADGFIIQGDAANDVAGSSVSSAGDVNGDGFDDLIIGAFGGDDGGTNAGEAYVIFGKSTGFGTDVAGRQVIDLTSLAAADGFIIQGDTAGDRAASVSSAGDVNGDGFDDLIVGAPDGDDGGSSAGEAYVIFGKSTGFGTDVAGRRVIDLTSLAPADGFIIQGDEVGDLAGFSVSSAGDVNGDGFDDLIVGAPDGDDGGTSAGEAYVIFGKSTGFGTDVAGRRVIDLTALAAADGFIVQGDVADDRAGFSVSSAGDVNGDGFDDLIVGAYQGDDGGTNAGEAYVIFGVAPTTSVTRTGTVASQSLAGGGGDDLLDGLDGDDRLFGNAGKDELLGGAGGDELDGGDGDDVLRGGSGNDAAVGGDGDDTIYGDDGGDTIDGGEGDDALSGGSGNDGLLGGGGDDTIEGGSGNDNIDGGEGFDTIRAGSGDDVVTTGGGNDSIDAGSGNDTVNGGSGIDALVGRDGDDMLDGEGGIDTTDGGLGDDSHFVDNAADIVVEQAGGGSDGVFAGTSYVLAAGAEVELLATSNAAATLAINLTANGLANTVVGNEGVNTLTGNGGNDSLSGLGGNDNLVGGLDNDSLSGGAGDDVLNGGAGNDTTNGGLGDDNHNVDSAGDAVVEAVGEGNDIVVSSVTYALGGAAEVERLVLSSAAATTALNLFGNGFGNNIQGNAGANVLQGQGGDDILVGFAGNDNLNGGTGNDTFLGGLGDDIYILDNANDLVIENDGEGNDAVFTTASYTMREIEFVERLSAFDPAGTDPINLSGNSRVNFIFGNAGANVLLGNGGDDVLQGRGGDDILNGGTGNDNLNGGLGNDIYFIDSIDDVIVELDGEGTNDRLFTSVTYILRETEFVEQVVSAVQSATNAMNLTGNSRINTLQGNDGNNIMDGKGGNDALLGFAGADTFVFSTTLNATSNVDTIVNFSVPDDIILLGGAAGQPFAALPAGILAASAFTIGSDATTAAHRIVYNSATGGLFYDADGAGGAARIQFAILSPGLALTNADFIVADPLAYAAGGGAPAAPPAVPKAAGGEDVFGLDARLFGGEAELWLPFALHRWTNDAALSADAVAFA